MRVAAFFDIDGTLFRDSLMIEHFKKLLKYELLDEALWHGGMKHTYSNWVKRRGNYDDYMLELAETYIESLKGMEKSKAEFVTSQVIDLLGDKVYMYTRNRIQRHKEMKHVVIFISGSPHYLVTKMARRYGIADCIGSKFLLDKNDRYTGEVEKMWDSASKAKALGSFQAKYDIDLQASYAYGDTSGDLSMFENVGHPVAINPTRELIEILRNNPELAARTEIIVERKDVIYHLDLSVSIDKAL